MSIQKFILLNKQRMAVMFVLSVEMDREKVEPESISLRDKLTDTSVSSVERREM